MEGAQPKIDESLPFARASTAKRDPRIIPAIIGAGTACVDKSPVSDHKTGTGKPAAGNYTKNTGSGPK